MTDTPRLIEESWIRLAVAVEIGDAPAIQLREMRRAFFAGARSYSNLVMQHASQADEPTEGDMALMDALEAEMAAFVVDVENGRA
ncbi:hypothetical protein OKC48_07415 [Methylorubrum extorquens]|uniref:hypothetical protein n=1 Tax=Methylorubrum extorquens TaxID=408 RepID=UPI00223796AF|nr:hypothetical protein [Methylorubrum extorquens]UYW28334.1 hypothetical protein OKC48_07415 [Methylorubrum extorquens]